MRGRDKANAQGARHYLGKPVTTSVSTRTCRWTTSTPLSLATRCSASPPLPEPEPGKATHDPDHHTFLEPSARRDEGASAAATPSTGSG